MEQHERENGRTDGVRSEDQLSHGDALGQALAQASLPEESRRTGNMPQCEQLIHPS
jgi:hypothetical protein